MINIQYTYTPRATGIKDTNRKKKTQEKIGNGYKEGSQCK